MRTASRRQPYRLRPLATPATAAAPVPVTSRSPRRATTTWPPRTPTFSSTPAMAPPSATSRGGVWTQRRIPEIRGFTLRRRHESGQGLMPAGQHIGTGRGNVRPRDARQPPAAGCGPQDQRCASGLMVHMRVAGSKLALGISSAIDAGRCEERKIDVYRYRDDSPHHHHCARRSHAASALIPRRYAGERICRMSKEP